MQVIVTKGLPASGKTTWAKNHIAKALLRNEIWKRVNKDDLRAMIDIGQWSKENEEFVLLIRDYVITIALLKDYNVIVDDTNLHPKHIQQIEAIVEAHNNSLLPKQKHCDLIIKDFTDVPLDVCLERDKQRKQSVGEKVLRDMNDKFLKEI